MNSVEFLAVALFALCVLSALGLIHLQNQINRLRKSQRALAEAVSIGIGSMIEYVDVVQKEKH